MKIIITEDFNDKSMPMAGEILEVDETENDDLGMVYWATYNGYMLPFGCDEVEVIHED